MSVKLMGAVLDFDMETTLKFVLLIMANAADDDGCNSFPKVSRICKQTSLKESTVRGALSKLRESGYLEVEQDSVRGKATNYRVLVNRPPVDRPLPNRPLSGSELTSSTQQIDLQQVAKNEHVSLLTRPLPVLDPKPTTPHKERADLPEWLPKQEWKDYCEMRQRIRAPMTEAAKRGIIVKLNALRSNGSDPAKVLAMSIERSWRGVFALSETERGNLSEQARELERKAGVRR